jgi:hypothetical protein
MKYWAMLAILAFAVAAHAAGPTREELAIRYSGPITISPGRVAAQAQEAPSPEWNRHAYSTPPCYYYCGWGWGYYGCFGRGWYGFGCFGGAPYTVSFNAP